MGNFSNYSKYNSNAAFSGIKFGDGSLVLETELNEMQDITNEARAEIIRQMTPSGILEFNSNKNLSQATGIDGSIGASRTSTLNSFIFAGMKVIMNGYLLNIINSNDSTNNKVTLPEPPLSGERDDLVFLEAWFDEIDYSENIYKYGGVESGIEVNHLLDSRIGEETNRRVQLKWRIRVVSGLDFNKYTEGFHVWGTSWNHSTNVKAQGGNSQPLTSEGINACNVFIRADSSTTTRGKLFPRNDIGLYIAGDGTQTSKDTLKTIDGYSYAIPLFRVKRRNSLDFSVSNPNGASSYFVNTGDVQRLKSMSTYGDTATYVFNSNDYAKIQVEDEFYWTSDKVVTLKIIEKLGNNQVKVMSTCYRDWSTTTLLAGALVMISKRPDGLYANVVDNRDIIDLRHKVSLNGFNYQSILDENFDKLIRGDLSTKEAKKMVKTYHGIPKTKRDANTVFYASFDGSITAEVGGNPYDVSGTYTFYPSCTGLGLITSRLSSLDKLYYSLGNISVFDTLTVECKLSRLEFTQNYRILTITGLVFGETEDRNLIYIWISNGSQHIIAQTGGDYAPINVSTLSPVLDTKNHDIRFEFKKSTRVLKIYLDGKLQNTITLSNLNPLCNAIIKNISFSPQNGSVISDVHVTLTDYNGEFPDLPKDFILGYADLGNAFVQRKTLSDAISTERIIAYEPDDTLYTKGVSSVKSFGFSGNWSAGDTITINGLCGEIISNPELSYSNNGVYEVLTCGTWSGLNTSTAIFTFNSSIPSTLTNLIIEVSYNLTPTSVSPGTNVVYSKLLSGEYNGSKLVAGLDPIVLDDLRGKVSGNLSSNPNRFKATMNDTVVDTIVYSPLDSQLSEVPLAGELDYVSDSKLFTTEDTRIGSIAQHHFQFNIVDIIEQKFGPIPALNKIKWIKDNVSFIELQYYGYGFSPNGNKVTVSRWIPNTSSWYGSSSHTNSTVTKLTSGGVVDMLTSNGWAYFVAYAEPADARGGSKVVTDYVSITIKFSRPSTHEALVPQDQRRDSLSISKILFLNKETKEVKLLFPTIPVSGLVSYGEYTPYQGQYNGSQINGKLLTSLDKIFVTSDGTGKKSDGLYVGSIASPISTHLPAKDYDYKLVKDAVSLSYVAQSFSSIYLFNLPILYIDSYSKSYWNSYSGVGVKFNPSSRSIIRGCDSFRIVVNGVDYYYSGKSFDLSKTMMKKVCCYGLISVSGELYLLVLSTDHNSNTTTYGNPLSAYSVDYFKISGRILIKE